MRLFKIIFVALFATVAMAGCGLFEEKLEKTIDENAGFSVFLTEDATEQQKSDLRAWLEKEPGITEVTFEDRATAYAKAKQLWTDDPEFLESVDADSLPETFRLKVKDAATAREIRDGADGAELKALPGVHRVIFQCTTVSECRELYSPAAPKPSN
ncbi:cell division protein FtsX [Actinoplanes regularis]|uniref:Cell division transport system permease protein n=1 Tax=Actinoplanes regularis TaxID=52697 RepID=A0A239JQ55_9ACTN|nr:permease-like cell division protein FtsX [Actinoplanes regularis]SNT08011.1 cell division transport system permease protein [Actinoplanes regularis]